MKMNFFFIYDKGTNSIWEILLLRESYNALECSRRIQRVPWGLQALGWPLEGRQGRAGMHVSQF